MKKASPEQPKKKSHKGKKLLKLAVLAAAAYGAKKLYDAKKKKSGSNA